MLPLVLELYDRNDLQYRFSPDGLGLRVVKSLFGGEDRLMSFSLPFELGRDYPEVGYGQRAELWQSLTRLFLGTQRSIEQFVTEQAEGMRVACPGYSIFLDDFPYDGRGKLWCDSRYGKWRPVTDDQQPGHIPERFRLDTQNRLFIAPVKGEVIGTPTYQSGSLYCLCSYQNIVRVSFDYEFVDPDHWWAIFGSYDADWGGGVLEWAATATASGVKDITLAIPKPIIRFGLWYSQPAVQYNGETGEDCYFKITNLRIWGENGPLSRAIENPSVIHVAENMVGQIEAATPLSSDKSQVRDLIPVRDTFTEAASPFKSYRVFDTFTGGNGVHLHAHTPDIDIVGGGWADTHGDWDIQGNRAHSFAWGVGSYAIATIDAGLASCIVECDVTATGYPGIVMRYQDTGNYWFFYLNPFTGFADFGYYNATVWNSLWTANVGAAPGVVYDLRVEMDGNVFNVYFNDVWKFSTTNTFLNTQTRHGIRATSAHTTFDNFHIYTWAGISLDAHIPDIDKERGGWVEARGDWNIWDNEANCSATGVPFADAIAVIDAGESDGIVCVDATVEASGNSCPGLIFRYLDLNNFWLLQLDPTTGNLALSKYQSGWTTFYNGALGVERSFTYNLMAKLRGDRIDIYLGGVWRYGRDDSFNQTATKHGLRAFGPDAEDCRLDNFEMFQALPLWPLYFEDEETFYGALERSMAAGDWVHKYLGWGVESGGDRVFLRVPDRSKARYIIHPADARRLSSKGTTELEFITDAWGQYLDEDRQIRYTSRYYAYITPLGITVSTTPPVSGDNSAQETYGVQRSKYIQLGILNQYAADDVIQHLLIERARPQITSSFEIYHTITDMYKGGAEIHPLEMETGYIVQMPYFEAAEAVGATGMDVRDPSTAFLLVGLEYDHDRRTTRLYPEAAKQDFQKLMQEKSVSHFPGGGKK